MYDNLQVWFQLVQRFISTTAFIDDDRVYIKEGGIIEIPMFDAETVMMFMNDHPHLTEDLFNEWRLTGDDPTFSIQREFSIILFEDMLEQDEAAKVRATFGDVHSGTGEENAVAAIINALASMGFSILNQTDNPKFGPIVKPEQERPELFQHALFKFPTA